MKPQEFEKKVWDWIEENRLVSCGDGVLLGVSGGADSVALLRFFHSISREKNLKLKCIHIEHGIRGEESLRDASFVKNLCKELQVPCKVIPAGQEIAAIEDTHASLEEKARRVRYEKLEAEAELFEQEIKERVHIGVAHHANDNVETLLFHLIRGTGLDGLRGMPLCRDRIIRPFLTVGRDEIEEYLENLQQTFCRDKTNEDVTYDRNRIRHLILPEMEKINPRGISNMNRAAILTGEAADYINAQAEKVLKEAVIASKEKGALGEISEEILKEQPDFLKREILHLWLEKYIPGAKDVGTVHLNMLLELLGGQPGHRCHLPKNRIVWKTYGGLAIGMDGSEAESLPEDIGIKADLEQGETLEYHYGRYQVRLCIKPYMAGQKIPGNIYTKWFDYDKIKNNILIRARRSGDFLTISKEGARKKLQDYFVNEKVPASKRDEVPLLCDGSHVLWVVGHRISEYYKVNTETKQILEVQFFEEKENE